MPQTGFQITAKVVFISSFEVLLSKRKWKIKWNLWIVALQNLYSELAKFAGVMSMPALHLKKNNCPIQNWL